MTSGNPISPRFCSTRAGYKYRPCHLQNGPVLRSHRIQRYHANDTPAPVGCSFQASCHCRVCKGSSPDAFHPTWARIQSPYNILKYSLQESARWSALIAVLSLLWLKEEHLKPKFVAAVTKVFNYAVLDSSRLPIDRAVARLIQGKTPVQIITVTMTQIRRTNKVLTTAEVLPEDRRSFEHIKSTILTERRMFELLCEVAAQSTGHAKGAAAAKAVTRRRGRGALPPIAPAGSRTLSHASSAASYVSGENQDNVEGDVEQLEVDRGDEEFVAGDVNIGTLTVAQKAHRYRDWANRPNSLGFTLPRPPRAVW